MHTLVDNKIVNHSYVVGALPVGAAPTTSSFSTGFNKLGKDNCKSRWETFKFCDLVLLTLEVWWYCNRAPKNKLWKLNDTIIIFIQENGTESFVCKMSAIWLSGLMLTLNVPRGQSYLGLTRSISWLLMPWLLMSPGHQQPWYWLYRIYRPFSYLRKDFKHLCQINVE